MTRLIKRKTLFTFFITFLVTQITFAEIIVDPDYGYSLDIPEGYEMTDMSNDGMSYMFEHQNIPLTFITKIYDNEGYMNSEEVLSSSMKKLSATFQPASFIWNKTQCAITDFQMYLDQEYSGWAVSTQIGNDTFLVLMCYSPLEITPQCEDFMISTLNSLCIDEYYYNTPGIITSFVYPQGKQKEYSLNIAGESISFNLNEIDQEAAQFVVDLEYRILVKYANHEKMYEAWDRYYRTIYRDNYGRIQDFSKNVYNTLYNLAEEERPEIPEIQYAQYLLSWVQTFDYVRAENRTESDFMNLPSVLLGKGSDCDNRSMLVAAVLEYSGIDSILLIYPEHSHALVAANIPKAQGQTFTNPENKEEYIMGETTAKVTWGTIAKEQADRKKCFSISLP